MTTRTAAEALEEVLALIKAHGSKGLASANCATAAHNFISAYADTLRAALAPPQEGEVEEWPEMWRAAWDKKPTHCACRFEWRPIPDWSGEPPKQLDECGFHKTQRESLLRATQSNGPASVQTPSRDGAESTAGLSQSAPAQEPVATLEAKVSTLLARALTTGYGSTEAIYALANLAREPLFAAPQPDKPCPHIVTTGTTSHCSLAERDARDAARYRWLRQQHEVKWEGPVPDDAKQTWFVTAWNGEVPGCLPGELDAAIDAAIKEQADADR